jgi:hypothetical protein
MSFENILEEAVSQATQITILQDVWDDNQYHHTVNQVVDQ